jgi:hypothetical protein
MSDALEAPMRLCCGQRHFGPVCPDGLVMCCLCFKRVNQDNLNITSEGKENVCRKCAQKEKNKKRSDVFEKYE